MQWTEHEAANGGTNFILICIDVLSKKLRARPMQNKSAAATIDALDSIFKEGVIPKKVGMDKGREFVNNDFKAFLKKAGVKYFTTEDDVTKAMISERVIQTLRRTIRAWMTHNNTHTYVPRLQDFVRGYNKTPHKSLGYIAPDDVTNENLIAAKFGAPLTRADRMKPLNRATLLRVGDLVRVSAKKAPFLRAHSFLFSEELFVVNKVQRTQPPTYKLINLDQTPVAGSFYQRELQKVNKNLETEEFLIEKIIRYKKKGGKKMALIQWKGYDQVTTPVPHPRSFNFAPSLLT